jgi:hypothetical protein
VQDFVDAHYKLSARRDSEFWRYQTSREFPERLNCRLAMYAAEMPNDINRLKSFAWAFNEVSWLDILNGYEFRYEKIEVSAEKKARAQQALRDIAATSRKGVDPRTFEPVVASRRDA